MKNAYKYYFTIYVSVYITYLLKRYYSYMFTILLVVDADVLIMTRAGA